MTTALATICAVCGVYVTTVSFLVVPNDNWPSKILFKVFPFFLGLATLFVSGKLFELF